MIPGGIDGVLARGRAMAEKLMIDTCRITAGPESEGPMDSETAQYGPGDRETVYEGPCRVQIRSSQSRSTDSVAGDREGVLQSPELQIPVVGTEAVSPGHIVEILAASCDSALAGRVYTVETRHEKTHATARRLQLREATS